MTEAEARGLLCELVDGVLVEKPKGFWRNVPQFMKQIGHGIDRGRGFDD